MPTELAHWIPAAVIVDVMLYLHRVTRQDMREMESRFEARMDRVESQIGELRERMAHLLILA